jgi:hypothetical protein
LSSAEEESVVGAYEQGEELAQHLRCLFFTRNAVAVLFILKIQRPTPFLRKGGQAELLRLGYRASHGRIESPRSLGGGGNLSPSDIELGNVSDIPSMPGKNTDEAAETPRPNASLPVHYDPRDDRAANPVPGSFSLYTPLNSQSGYGDGELDGRSGGAAKAASFEEKPVRDFENGGGSPGVGKFGCLPSSRQHSEN